MAQAVAYPDNALETITGPDFRQDAQAFIDLIERKIDSVQVLDQTMQMSTNCLTIRENSFLVQCCVVLLKIDSEV